MSFFRCWAVKNVLDLYVDSRLTPARRRQVQAHLHDCADCRKEAEALSSVRQRLTAASAVKVPAGLADSILKRLEQPESEPLVQALWPSPGQAAALAALALVLLAQKGPGVPSQADASLPPRLESR